MATPVVVDFPLRGEWVSPNTPGKKVPSHGTDMLGQRYAYDFVRTDPAAKGMRFYRPSTLRYLLLGVSLQECFGWGQPIYSPVSGTVVDAQDGWPERNPVHLARDLAIVLKHALTFDLRRATTLQPLVGNYIIIASADGYAFLAHAQAGSLLVSPGDQVSVGQPLARVGHSGNTTAPHLHFHLMDDRNLTQAQGIPCCFREYEVYRAGAWLSVRNGIPGDTDRMRKL